MLEPLMPQPFRITSRNQETADVFTFELEPLPATPFPFQPGQFNMLYAFGVGEVPISMSGGPAASRKLVHTIRTVGSVTSALSKLRPGDVVGVRGPYGAGWPVDLARGEDVVFAAGGLGIAPLRPALYHVAQNRDAYGRAELLYGARTPKDLMYLEELETLCASARIGLKVIVGQASPDWKGEVGHVTGLVPKLKKLSSGTRAFLCGPEIMMRFTAVELMQNGLSPDLIFVSMERNMKCAVGFCGRCQLGGTFICKDGPVFPYSRMETLMRTREL